MLRFNRKLRQVPFAVGIMVGALALPVLSHAQAVVNVVAVSIPAQPAESALKTFVEQTKFQLVYPAELVRGRTTKAVAGDLQPVDALAKMLEGSGISIVATGENAATLQQSSERVSLDTVIVSARKKDERVIDVPIAITAITGEDIKKRGANSVGDVLQDSAGVSSFDYGMGMTKVSIRGISTSLGGNDNGFYLNDLPFTGVTVPISPDVRAWDLDRIEVLRGPQGTLFGEGSMGGTVRILTNRPRLNEWSFGAQLTGSSTQGGSASDGEKFMLNIPVGDMVAVRLAATREKLGGWIDDDASGRKNVNEANIQSQRAAVVFEPTDRLRIDASYWRHRAEYEAGSNALDGMKSPPSSLGNKMNYDVRGLTANYDFDAASLFYGFSSIDWSFPQSGPYFGGQLDASIDLKLKTHELRLGSTGKGPWKWTVGYYQRTAQRLDNVKLAVFGLDNVSDTNTKGSSIFGEISYEMPQVPVELTLGLRRFRDRIDQQDYNSGVPAAPVHGTFSSTNPRFSAAWKIDPTWQLYASAAKGFRSGQAQASATIGLAQQMGLNLPSTVPADSIWSYELGTKASLLNRRLFVEGAVYHSDWKNFAVRAPIPNTGLNAIQVAPGTTTDGIEGSVRYEFSNAFSASINASYSRARFKESVAGTGITKGATVDDMSPFVLAAAVDYNLGTFSDWTSKLHVGFQHSSRREAPSLAPAFVTGDPINNLNARLGFEKGNWTVTLFGENLTNEDGSTTARQAQALADGSTVTFGPRLRPRSIGLELRYWMGR